MTRAILLTGTPELEPARRPLRAGRLGATFDGGGLRWIRWGEVEVLRAILFLVRTPGWGTPAPQISGLEIAEETTRFSIAYEARYADAGATLVARIRLVGEATGHLRAEADIRAEAAPFQTNRTGFVILHPLDGFAGTTVEVEHASGGQARQVIATQISPGQPVMDLRAITHHPVPGLAVETRFEGDVFEMEDQRNWSDASFKTYNRPIALPYPYPLTPGAPIAQAVAVSITDPADTAAGDRRPPAAVAPPSVSTQRLPGFALPLDSLAAVTAALPWAERLATLRPRWLLWRHDATRETAAADLAPLAQLLAATGAALEVQAIVAAPDDAGAEAEIAALAARLAGAGIAVARIGAFAKIDEQSFQPGEPRPPHPAEPALAAALARHFPRARRIGGTPAFFTELNRKRPDPALWDGVSFATTPVVHAADDASVLETLATLPHLLASATALSGGLPLSIGPTGIGARLNPYGPAPTQNVPDAREGMAARDPRQRGLLAAAWTVGYLTRIAPFAPERFAFGAATGPFGLLSTPQDWARPLWDALPAGSPYPLYHVARWISGAAGAALTRADTTGGLADLAWHDGTQGARLLANLTPAPLALPAGLSGRASLLDVASLGDGSGGPQSLAEGAYPERLDAYAVLHLTQTGVPA